MNSMKIIIRSNHKYLYETNNTNLLFSDADDNG